MGRIQRLPVALIGLRTWPTFLHLVATESEGIVEVKALKEKHQFESDLSFERRLGASAINQIIGTLSTMTFGVALLFAFAGWIAGCSR